MTMNDTNTNAASSTGRSMISSTDVNGTTVFGASGDEVGHIDHLMIDKASGRVAYAVMNFGGFLGMGEETHLIPWDTLKYDASRDGYVTDITREQLGGAPARSETWHDDTAYRDDVFKYYNAAPYWI